MTLAKEDSRIHKMRLAELICEKKNARMTGLRRKILEILIEADYPLKAYDIIELVGGTRRRITPSAVYRTLDFLLKHGLAHKINSINAYSLCFAPETKHTPIIFVCLLCKKAEEINDKTLDEVLRSRLDELGFAISGSVEIQGACKDCLAMC
ncbi:MAG: transcriptional repressor [Helicobacteraceae bacterium]|jgi:Fur family zinc uptake transcriptional regulator|nr:transcriptional repressor [Helicobacteraceae bacterium]